MALEDELAKLTRRRGGVGRPPGQNHGVAIGVAAIGIGLIVIIAALVALSSLARTGPNEVGVVYNGGPLDKKTQRQLIQPASGLTWTGWLSQDPRLYPSEGSPRRYIITSTPGRGDRVGVDDLRVPTADGIDVGLEAKISFTTGFTGQSDDALVKEFDARFGNRTYPVPGQTGRLHPWEGDEGFGAFLDTEFRPVLDNALRETLGRFRCDELVSSCALLSNKGGALDQRSGAKTNANLVAVQKAIGDALNTDLSTNLGGQYFKNVQVVRVRGAPARPCADGGQRGTGPVRRGQQGERRPPEGAHPQAGQRHARPFVRELSRVRGDRRAEVDPLHRQRDLARRRRVDRVELQQEVARRGGRWRSSTC